MHFGERVRQFRTEHGLTQRDLAAKISVSDTYISKVENENLHFGDYPSEKFIHKLVEILDADEEELFLLAHKVPETTGKRVRERPDAFHTLAGLDDEALNQVVAHAEKVSRTEKRR